MLFFPAEIFMFDFLVQSLTFLERIFFNGKILCLVLIKKKPHNILFPFEMWLGKEAAVT